MKMALIGSTNGGPSLRQFFRQLISQAFQVVSNKEYAEMYASDLYQEKISLTCIHGFEDPS